MTATSTARRGRRAAEALMTDTCSIYRLGAPVFDPDTGHNTRARTTLYTGRCRARPYDQGSQADVGQTGIDLLSHLVSVPVSAATTAVAAGDVVELTASADPSLVGKALVVHGLARGTHVTARRLSCKEVS